MAPRTPESTFPPTEVIDIDAEIIAAGPGDVSYDPPLRAISIGVAGTLKVDLPSSSAKTIDANALAIGMQHVMTIDKIYNTGTTATEVWGWR